MAGIVDKGPGGITAVISPSPAAEAWKEFSLPSLAPSDPIPTRLPNGYGPFGLIGLAGFGPAGNGPLKSSTQIV